MSTYHRKCPVCGKEFDSTRPHAKFCSKRCRHVYVWRCRNGRTIEDSKVKCCMCGKEFLPGRGRKGAKRKCPECFGTPAAKEYDRLAQNARCRERYAKMRSARRDATVEAGILAQRDAEQVEFDMTLPARERYEASKKWTRAQRDYAKRIYEKFHS